MTSLETSKVIIENGGAQLEPVESRMIVLSPLRFDRLSGTVRLIFDVNKNGTVILSLSKDNKREVSPN
jgi:hypothetical protein